MNFWSEGVMTGSVCFARLSTYDDPVFNWRFSFCHIFNVIEISLAERVREDPFY